MHYYQFNIGDYTSHTARLSIIEDLAYRRLLDLYYLNEHPFNGTSTDAARDVGLQDYQTEVDYILTKFFPLSDDVWRNKRADVEISYYHSRQRAAIKAGKASGKARRGKAKERTLNDRSTNPQRKRTNPEPTNNQEPVTINDEPVTNNHKPITKNQKPNGKDKSIVELKPDDSAVVFKYWQSICKHPKAALDDKRKALIKKQLKFYSTDDLCQAIHGCSITPHNNGDNKQGAIYDSIELILRDASQIDRFMANGINPPLRGKTIQQSSDEYQTRADRIAEGI